MYVWEEKQHITADFNCVMSHNNNLAVKLWNVPVPGRESFNCLPHTIIATFISA